MGFRDFSVGSTFSDYASLAPFLFTINAASAAAEWWYTPYP